MSKNFNLDNFWIFVGTIIVCSAPWLALAATVAFFVAMYFCTPSSAEPDIGDPDGTIEWPTIEFPNVAAVIDEEEAAEAEEKAAIAAIAKAEYEAKAERDFTYFKIAIVPVLVGGILISNYIEKPVAIDKKMPTTTVCVKNAAGNTECSYAKK